MSEQLRARRTELLAAAREAAEKARDEHRDLTVAESDQVNAALAEVKAIDQRAATDQRAVADAASKELLGKLDDMARGATGTALSGSGHIALTGKHAETMA
jgi:hypothetical protein